jgi:outer membrane lipoprotein-sorting protein
MAGKGQGALRGMSRGMRQSIGQGVSKGGRCAALALLIGIGCTSVAWAEAVPLPTPAPFPKEGAAQGRPAQQGSDSGLLGGLKKMFNLDKQPEAAAPAAPVTTNVAAFDAKQRAQVDKVSSYLSSVQQLTGNFVQVGPDGTRTRGEFYIQKPGKVRFEYDPPTPIEIVADGQSVIVRDRKLSTQDLFPLSQTPLRFLLSDRIDLLKETNVVAVRADDTFVAITIEEKQALIGTSKLMMMIGAKDNQLKQWTVTDPQGFDTTVAVSNLDTSKRPDPGLFKIDYTRYVQ